MPLYKIADLKILIEPIYSANLRQLAPYICKSSSYDIKISVNNDEIKNRCVQSDIPCTPESAESVLILTELCNTVLESFNGFFFHSSSLMLDNEAYVFTAPSGTGKSTHTALWRRHFGDRVTMINDDKPIIRKADGKFYIYGTPWMGKANIGNNVKAPVKAVYVLQRGSENSVRRVTTGEVIKQILQATLIPTKKSCMSRLLSLFDDFFSSVPLFLLTCSPDEDAVITAYNAANTNHQ